MSYTHADGSPDTLQDVTTSCRAFAVALGYMLQENEGVVVELKYDDRAPDDYHGKLFVYKTKTTIDIERADDSDLPPGQMLWVHKEE